MIKVDEKDKKKCISVYANPDKKKDITISMLKAGFKKHSLFLIYCYDEYVKNNEKKSNNGL